MTELMSGDDTERQGGRQTIQSVDRAAMLIKAIADSRQPPTVIELAATCGLNRSTAWRLLATLDAQGLIERDPVSQRYSLGYAFLRIAAGAEPDPLVRQARPVLERLAIATGEATNLAVVKRFRLVYVDQVDPPQIMAPNWFGRDVPLHATSTGKAFLAWLPPEEARGLLDVPLPRFTDTTLTDPESLMTQLVTIRERGYAECAGELEPALYGVSAPILNSDERPLGVFSIWGPVSRVPTSRFGELGPLAVEAAEEVREALLV